MHAPSDQNTAELLCVSILLNEVFHLLTGSTQADATAEITTMAASCGVECVEPVTDWTSLRHRFQLRSSDPLGRQQILLAGAALLEKYPTALLCWLRHAPASFFPPVERLELIFHVQAQATGDNRVWLSIEAEKAFDRLRNQGVSIDWRTSRQPPMANPPLTLTRSQQAALLELSSLATLYFRGDGDELPIRPRFTALLVGPTGCGKSFLAERVAGHVGAHFIPFSLGEWVPAGVKDHPPTIRHILGHLLEHERVVLLLDEVDKLQDCSASAWSRSCAAEIFALLDRRLPVTEFALHAKLGPEESALLEQRIRRGLWFIAAGTWQSAYGARSRRRIGFDVKSPEVPEGVPDAVHDGRVPLELLGRCGGARPIEIEYPDLEETDRLLRTLGLHDLAAKIGRTLRADEVKWQESGWRCLEALAAELMIARERRHSEPPESACVN